MTRFADRHRSRPELSAVGPLAGTPVPVQKVTYWCRRGHRTALVLDADAPVPDEWSCRCGLPAGQDRAAPPEPDSGVPFKTHFAYLQERRTDAEGAALLDEALDKVRARREPESPSEQG